MRNVIVTGGSRGLGLGIARKLILSGFRAIAIARKESAELAAAKTETGADTSRVSAFCAIRSYAD